jgi:type 1 fimbria pilin
MKKKYLATIVFGLLINSASALADNSTNDSGLITFDGAVSAHTCTITSNNGVDASNITISMPIVSADQVMTTTADAGPVVGPKEFELSLSECDAAMKSASISFASPQFVELSSGTLKNDPTQPGGANNVNIALYNNAEGDTAQVRIGLPDDKPQTIDLSANHGGIFAYTASYVPSADMDKTTNPVVPGTVSTNATFTVSYQ